MKNYLTEKQMNHLIKMMPNLSLNLEWDYVSDCGDIVFESYENKNYEINIGDWGIVFELHVTSSVSALEGSPFTPREYVYGEKKVNIENMVIFDDGDEVFFVHDQYKKLVSVITKQIRNEN